MLLECVTFTLLLVLERFFAILILLQSSIGLQRTSLISFILSTIDFFAQRIHLVRLPLHEIVLARHNFFLSCLHVGSALFILQCIRPCLHLVGVCVFFLFSKIRFHLPQVEQLGGEFKRKGQGRLKLVSVVLQRHPMPLCHVIHFIVLRIFCLPENLILLGIECIHFA